MSSINEIIKSLTETRKRFLISCKDSEGKTLTTKSFLKCTLIFPLLQSKKE